MTTLKDIEKVIFQLSPQERAILARNLIHSLESEETDADVDYEALWIAEADRRYHELKVGKVKGKPVEQVFEELKTRFE
jgi:putative addiction module component (TIGR02574 family)